MKVPRYRVALFGIFGYFAFFVGRTVYSKLQPKAPIKFESAEEEDFVKRYIKHTHEEAHKPVLLRQPYTGPSGI
ncbi:hypothetical protein HDU67_008445 [Dinochytrium kinnereticum]|nr:hypothetical protein HDU67_008445 [Dinochytrium kinnereticum]